MAYKILRPDGTTLLTLADNTVDQSATSLTLVGKNWSGYGEYINNNLVRILSNSANVTSKPPRSPITGQLWYDTAVKRVKVYDGGFKTINGVPFSSTTPATIQGGDLWYDTANLQLKLFNGTTSTVIGPSLPSSAGASGWVIPPIDATVNDSATDTVQDVLILKSYNESLAIANGGDAFTVTSVTSSTYIPNAYGATPVVVTGVTISDDLRVYGQMTNHGMSATFNIDTVSPFPFNDPTNALQIQHQNGIIEDFLNQMFPPNAKSTGTYQYPGMPLGSVARVATHKNDGTQKQVRLFHTIVDGSTSTWRAWNIFTLENIID